ncbi:MAG: nitrilase family protein [Bacteroidota bacterium]|nr:nitrilase family protein [Bacteroidota bacterium]
MSTLTITTIQADLAWEDKDANLRAFEEKIMAIRETTELVVLPEMFSTGFSMRPRELAEKMDGPTVGWMKRVAARKKVILTGSLIIEEGGDYYNRLIWMLPNGEYGTYDKRHRFAYAGEHEEYTAGHKRLIASVKGWRVLLLVCYDLRFPVWSRQQIDREEGGGNGCGGSAGAAGLEYDLLLYVANWPDRRSHAWRTLLQARAIENQAYVVGVNRVGNDGNNIYHSGDSMVVDPLGEVVWQGSSVEGVATHLLTKERLDEVRRRFPFWRDADRFTIEP